MFRLPWMYGSIFGFHRETRWPKWTPASTSAFTSSAWFAAIQKSSRSIEQRPDPKIPLVWDSGKLAPPARARLSRRPRRRSLAMGLGLDENLKQRSGALRSCRSPLGADATQVTLGESSPLLYRAREVVSS